MTLTLPSTGAPWSQSNLNGFRASRIRRGGRVAILARDYFGSTTDISPTVFGPLAQDGNPRVDLLAMVPSATSAGVWVPNNADNLGWYLLGAVDPKGVDITPDMTVDKLEILQTNATVRSDIQKEGATIGFTAFESTALVDALRNNNPLSTMLDDGATNYGSYKLTDAGLVERQILLIRVDSVNGLPEYTTEGVARCALDKINKRTWDKKNPDAFDVTWDVLVDPWFTNLDGEPIVQYTWRGGAGWNSAGGSPVFGASAPTATAVTGAKATITLDEPTDQDPETVTYTVTQQTAGTGAYTAATIQAGSPVGVGTGTLTFTVTGLTASSTYKFEIVATGADGAVTTSVTTASITAIA